MYALTQALPKDDIHIPVFVAASADDATVDSSATLRFIQRAQHPASSLVWYSTKIKISPSPTGGGVGVGEHLSGGSIEWVDSAISAQKILSSAHTAVVMPPDDGHYGAEGEYKNCLHYHGSEEERYVMCLKAKQEVSLGEVNEQNLQLGLLRRLTFNPHFAAMEASMQRFIKELK
jgi:hypothetical protein